MVAATVVLAAVVVSSLSSSSFVKIVWYNLSWNSFANRAACLSGLTSGLASQSQVMFTLQLPEKYKLKGA